MNPDVMIGFYNSVLKNPRSFSALYFLVTLVRGGGLTSDCATEVYKPFNNPTKLSVISLFTCRN